MRSDTEEGVGPRMLARPAIVSDADLRRARLLRWLLISLLGLVGASLVLVLVEIPADSPSRAGYLWLIATTAAMLAVALALHYVARVSIAAVFTVICMALVPWTAVLIDPSVREGDYVPMTYLAVSILVSGVLLPSSFTGVLAGVQVTGLIILALIGPSSDSFNFSSLIGFVVTASALAFVSGLVSRGDTRQIESLSQLLPICANCKSVRDDSGYWHEVEAYLSQAAHAELTHGICPVCVERLYPELAEGESPPGARSPGDSA